jgi:hypothetical protein
MQHYHRPRRCIGHKYIAAGSDSQPSWCRESPGKNGDLKPGRDLRLKVRRRQNNLARMRTPPTTQVQKEEQQGQGRSSPRTQHKTSLPQHSLRRHQGLRSYRGSISCTGCGRLVEDSSYTGVCSGCLLRRKVSDALVSCIWHDKIALSSRRVTATFHASSNRLRDSVGTERDFHRTTERVFRPLNPKVGAHSGRAPLSFIFGKRCTRFRSAICPSNRASWPPMQACGPALNARC